MHTKSGKYTPKLEVDKVGSKGIAELECGEGEEISFTTISSCVGVIGRKGNSLIGLHLPAIDKEGKKASDAHPGELKSIVAKHLP